MRKLEIKSERTRLFVPEENEASAVLQYFVSNQDHLRSSDPILPMDFLTLDFWERRLKHNILEFERDQSARFFIEPVNQPKRIVGLVNFTQIARGPFQACYLGYSIDQSLQGMGMMFEALEAGIKYIFEQKHIHRIMANHLEDNLRSAKVLRRLGFRLDGSSPEYLYINGAWRTHILNSLTNLNWVPREEDMNLFR